MQARSTYTVGHPGLDSGPLRRKHHANIRCLRSNPLILHHPYQISPQLLTLRHKDLSKVAHQAQPHRRTRNHLPPTPQRSHHSLVSKLPTCSTDDSRILTRHRRSHDTDNDHCLQIRPAILRKIGDECGHRIGFDVSDIARLVG